MEFDYTDHAEENIKERKLSKKVIEDVVKNPEKVIDSRFRRKIAQKAIAGKLLRVIYEQKDNVYIIVTAYYTKPERYG
jgi:transcriptional regulator NrdR family protein